MSAEIIKLADLRRAREWAPYAAFWRALGVPVPLDGPPKSEPDTDVDFVARVTRKGIAFMEAGDLIAAAQTFEQMATFLRRLEDEPRRRAERNRKRRERRARRRSVDAT